MADERRFTSQRAGNWSVTSDQPTSPWYDAGAGIDQASLAAYPVGGAGSDGDTVGGGDAVVIAHDIVLDINGSAGASRQEAGWGPLNFSPTDGSAFTDLATGTYRAAYVVSSSYGGTMGRQTESALVSIVHGASRPRVTFPLAPPAGCTYQLHLTGPTGEDGHYNSYCWNITGSTVDLVSEKYDNTYISGVATGGGHAYYPLAGSSLGSDLTDQLKVAITILDSGSLTIAAGMIFTLRGDLVIASNAGSTKDFLILEAGGGFGFDGSLAVDPKRTNYRAWFRGGGKIRFKD